MPGCHQPCHTVESIFFPIPLAGLPGKMLLPHVSHEKRLVGELISSGFHSII